MATKELDTRFSKFGTVSFTAITKVNDFIDHLSDGPRDRHPLHRLRHALFSRRAADCFRCLASNMEWFECRHRQTGHLQPSAVCTGGF